MEKTSLKKKSARTNQKLGRAARVGGEEGLISRSFEANKTKQHKASSERLHLGDRKRQHGIVLQTRQKKRKKTSNQYKETGEIVIEGKKRKAEGKE